MYKYFEVKKKLSDKIVLVVFIFEDNPDYKVGNFKPVFSSEFVIRKALINFQCNELFVQITCWNSKMCAKRYSIPSYMVQMLSSFGFLIK